MTWNIYSIPTNSIEITQDRIAEKERKTLYMHTYIIKCTLGSKSECKCLTCNQKPTGKSV